MKILIVNWEDPGVWKVKQEAELTQEELKACDEQEIDILKAEQMPIAGFKYYRAIISDDKEEVEGEEEPKKTYAIDSWENLDG